MDVVIDVGLMPRWAPDAGRTSNIRASSVDPFRSYAGEGEEGVS
jgi:hypothetical protein